MASSSKGLRLLKCMEFMKTKPSFDASTVLQKVNLQSASNGVLKCSFKIEPLMCNMGSALHGGYLASVADVISFYSVLSNPDGKFSWTTTLNMTYIKAVRVGEIVNVETKPLVTGVSPITEVYFRNGDGKLIGKGTATFLVANEKIQRSSEETCKFDVSFTARGLMPPVFTPFNEDLTVNYGVIPAYANYLADAGIKSVLVGGTTGEHMTLSVSDRKKVVDAWVAVSKTTGLHIQVQVGGAPLADVLDLARYCQEAGVDSLLSLPELYFKPTTVEDLVFYLAQVAKAAPKLPVLYYHIPSMSKVEINMPAFIRAATASIPNFKGIKFTSNDLSEGAQALRALKEGQEIFLGSDTLLAPATLLGIKSSISTTFNLFPRLAQEIVNAVEQNDVQRARALQEKLSLAVEAHTGEGPWVPIMKAGMEIVSGIKVGPPALPQKPLSAEARQRIHSKLRTLGLVKY